MPKDDCNADNVAGRIAGEMEKDGHLLDDSGLDSLDAGGQANYFESTTLREAETFDVADPQDPMDALRADADEVTSNEWGGGNPVKGVLNSFRDPSAVLGYDIVQPVIDFETALHESGGTAQDYFSGIKDIFKDLDDVAESLESDSQKAYYVRYKKDQLSGGAFFSKSDTKHPATKMLTAASQNVVSNTIMSSHRVIVGNIMEGAMKLPAHYPTTMLPAFIQEMASNPWRIDPVREAQGVYGYFGNERQKGRWNGLIGLSDIPFKNITYAAGEMAHGDGPRAVQEIAFAPRPGNVPEIYRNATGRSIVQLAGFTINSYKMALGMVGEALHGHPQKLVIYLGMAALLGGLDNAVKDQFENPERSPVDSFVNGSFIGMIPVPVEWLIETAFPDSRDWFEENKGYTGSLFRLGNLGGLYAGFDIFNRVFKTIGRDITKAGTLVENEEYGEAAMVFGDLGLEALKTTSGIGGGVVRVLTGMMADAGLQKAYKTAREVFIQDMEMEDVPGFFQQKYFPKD